jgi:predicted DNA binding CopG/RHH family protein
MKKPLNTEERSLLRSYERGEWRTPPDMAAEIARHTEYAKAANRKNKRVNIRISAGDLASIQHRAVEEGIPYQTLIASLIHKYSTGQLVERR